MSNAANKTATVDNLAPMIGGLNAYDEDCDGYEPGGMHDRAELAIARALMALRNTEKARGYLATLNECSRVRVIRHGFALKARAA